MAAETEYQEAVRTLVRLLHDGVKGFREVAGMLHGNEYRRFYLEEADVRGVFAAELERALESEIGSSIQEDGTMMGSLHRTYFELRDAMGADDETLLEMSARCEHLLMRMYRDVLAKEMPGGLRAVVVHQDEHVRRVHAMIVRYGTDARVGVGMTSAGRG